MRKQFCFIKRRLKLLLNNIQVTIAKKKYLHLLGLAEYGSRINKTIMLSLRHLPQYQWYHFLRNEAFTFLISCKTVGFVFSESLSLPQRISMLVNLTNQRVWVGALKSFTALFTDQSQTQERTGQEYSNIQYSNTGIYMFLKLVLNTN